MTHDRTVSYQIPIKIISFVVKTLRLEKETDFILASVETLYWIASELSRGRKIFSSNKDMTDIYEYPQMNGKEGIRELIIRRNENYKLKKEEDDDTDWLKNNFVC